ncbi:MAG TPA: c-type cytochrome domain-containing protein [Polyangia bacterium]|nr:c-type cytochrome domain-containing protein [Polyangia bacterium]
MFLPRLAVLAAVAALLAAGCGGSTDDRPAKWSFISATITEPSCATVNCHSQVSQRAGVDLHARDVGYYTLKNGFYVIPKDVIDSSLVYFLNASGSLRMPPDNPLPAADILLIEKWIDDGAQND